MGVPTLVGHCGTGRVFKPTALEILCWGVLSFLSEGFATTQKKLRPIGIVLLIISKLNEPMVSQVAVTIGLSVGYLHVCC